MKKTNKNTNTCNPDPYEDIVRFEKLDPYETLINLDISLKQKIQSNVNNYLNLYIHLPQ